MAVSVRGRMFRLRRAQRAGEKEGRPCGAAALPYPPNGWCWKKRASVLSRHRLGASRQQVAPLRVRTGGTGRRDPRGGRGGGHAIRRDRKVFRCGGVGGGARVGGGSVRERGSQRQWPWGRGALPRRGKDGDDFAMQAAARGQGHEAGEAINDGQEEEYVCHGPS